MIDLNRLGELEKAAPPRPWDYTDAGRLIRDANGILVAIQIQRPEFITDLANAAPALIAIAKAARKAMLGFQKIERLNLGESSADNFCDLVEALAMLEGK